MMDDGAPAVGVRDPVVDQALVKGQVRLWTAFGYPVAGSGNGSFAFVGPTHEPCGGLGECDPAG